jgi:dTDP-4-amino-4,6-dideoxygalactose transaminase
MIPISRPSIGDAERRAVLDVLDSGMIVQGPRTATLEERFAELCGVQHAVATSSGTTALHLALLAHGIGEGDEVITTPFSFVATVNTILQAGATPVFVDVDEATFNLDVSKLESAVTARTRAVMPVHLYGQTCDMTPLLDIATRHDLVVIEDACQAVGALDHGRAAGSFGTGAFSLYATKNLAAGEGGMITTDDPEIADRCRLLRNHGMRARYQYEMLGYNFRMTDLHAAIALAQLERLPELDARRADNAEWMNERIESVRTPAVADGRRHVWHQYTVRVPEHLERDKAVARLTDAGVGTGIFYPTPLHQLDHVRAVVGDVHLPVAEALAASVLSLPVHPSLTAGEREAVVRHVNELA